MAGIRVLIDDHGSLVALDFTNATGWESVAPYGDGYLRVLKTRTREDSSPRGADVVASFPQRDVRGVLKINELDEGPVSPPVVEITRSGLALPLQEWKLLSDAVASGVLVVHRANGAEEIVFNNGYRATRKA